MKKTIRKGRWWRRFLRVLASLIILLIIGCFIFDHYVQFRKSDKELQEIFTKQNIQASLNYYSTHGRTLRYVSVGDTQAPGTLLFLHGSPGSFSYYTRRFQDTAILARFRIYAVDRPGYGYSGFGKPEPSIQVQSEMIRPLLDSLQRAKHPIIIVGSSYGASIACRMAMDHPELVDGLVLTGPSLGPGLEKYFWFTDIIESPLIRWFMPRLFKSANTEKVHHREELEKMLPLWKTIRIPVAYIQGVKDNIIDTSNAGFARKHLINAPYLNIQFVEGREHRLAQYEWETFRKNILDIYERAARLQH